MLFKCLSCLFFSPFFLLLNNLYIFLLLKCLLFIFFFSRFIFYQHISKLSKPFGDFLINYICLTKYITHNIKINIIRKKNRKSNIIFKHFLNFTQNRFIFILNLNIYILNFSYFINLKYTSIYFFAL